MIVLQPTDPRVQQAIAMYQSGLAVRPICKLLKMDGNTLRRSLIELGLLRTRSEAGRNGKGVAAVTDDALDILTPDAMYWIGFLHADGHIEKEPRPRITLTLAEVDRSHLEKFSQFFGGNVTIRNVTSKTERRAPGQVNPMGRFYRAAFSSARIHQRLKDLGFTHNKTYSILPPNTALIRSRDFWRGVVDGDGWLCMSNEKRAEGKYNSQILGLSGTDQTLIEFLTFLQDSGIDIQTVPRKDARNHVWTVNIHGAKVKQVAKLLYYNATTYLERKYMKYQEFCPEPS